MLQCRELTADTAIGTYVRTAAIDTLVNKFLAADPGAQKQIISLGAGSDTRYFRIISKDPTVKLVYHELDFPTNVAQKISAIQHTPSLLAVIRSTLSTPSDLQITAHTLTSPTYNIHPLDLRTLAIDPSTSASPPLPTLPHLSTAAPTLLLSECCLIYLSPHDADSILATLTTSLIPPSTPLALVLYEPIRPHDPFGRVMISNLAARGIHLQTLQKYSSLSRQRARLRSAGFVDGQAAADVDFIWGRWVGEAEKERVAGLEMLDELEEWVLLARHYCVAWGWRDEVGEGGGLFGTAWEGVVGQEGNDEEEGID